MNRPPETEPLERLQAALGANVGGCSGWDFDGTDPAGGFRFSCHCGAATDTYSTYAEGVRSLDAHLDGFPGAIREFVRSWFNDHPPVTGDMFGNGWSVHLETRAGPDSVTTRRAVRILVSSSTSRGPETEPVGDEPHDDEPWDGYPLPAVDFPVYGCTEEWTGPRWLDFVQFHWGTDGEAITEVWTAHGDGRAFDPASPSLRVGTVPLNARESLEVGPTRDLARAVAFTAAFALLDRTSPELPEPQLRQLRRATMVMVDELADDWLSWPTADWEIDGQPAPARVTTWAGAWAAITFAVPGVAIVVIANGVEPDAVRLADVGDGHAYHVDLRLPLNYPGALQASAQAALGEDADCESQAWPMQSDHERLLNR